MRLLQGCTNIKRIQKPPQNSRFEKGDMTQFHTKDPQIFGTTIQNLVSMATWHLGLVHPWIIHILFSDLKLWKLQFIPLIVFLSKASLTGAYCIRNLHLLEIKESIFPLNFN